MDCIRRPVDCEDTYRSLFGCMGLDKYVADRSCWYNFCWWWYKNWGIYYWAHFNIDAYKCFECLFNVELKQFVKVMWLWYYNASSILDFILGCELLEGRDFRKFTYICSRKWVSLTIFYFIIMIVLWSLKKRCRYELVLPGWRMI